MKILVTGAAGFIGSHLSEFLLRDGHNVCGIDNYDPFYSRSIKEKNAKVLLGHNKMSFYELDLLDQVKLNELFDQNKFDLVVHLAAKAGVRPSLIDPTGYARANIEASVSLMEAMRKGLCTKLVFASSSSVYGKSQQVPFTETDPLQDVISAYAATKKAGEVMTQFYHNLYQFDVANLRFFTVYGPRQRPDLAIHKFLRAALEDRPIVRFGDGSMARDYTYIDDIVKGIWGAIKKVSQNKNFYSSYNLGNSSPHDLNQLIKCVEKVTGKKLKIESSDAPLGDVPITFADITKAQRELDYHPTTKLEDGMTVMYQWMKQDL